jgi:hypothetical protein
VAAGALNGRCMVAFVRADDLPSAMETINSWVRWISQGSGTQEHHNHFLIYCIHNIAKALLKRRFADEVAHPPMANQVGCPPDALRSVFLPAVCCAVASRTDVPCGAVQFLQYCLQVCAEHVMKDIPLV